MSGVAQEFVNREETRQGLFLRASASSLQPQDAIEAPDGADSSHLSLAYLSFT